MADNKNTNKKPNPPKDLPTKPVDKKQDDKVKGGMGGIKQAW